MVQVRQPFYSLPRTTQNFSETAVAPPYFTPALAAALTVALTPLHQMIARVSPPFDNLAVSL